MKEYPNDMHDELLVKYLIGEAEPVESVQVEQWIAASEANRKYYDQYKFIWEQSRQLKAQRPVSEDEAWKRFKEFRSERMRGKAPVVQMKNRWYGWMRMAGIFVLIAAGGILYLLNRNEIAGSGKMISLQSGNQVLTDTLADGSVVTLNKQSTLAYREQFSGESRTVVLEGEAFFNVASDKAKPFIIHVEDVDVTVLGTSFNIKRDSDKTEVIVETGKVEVSKKQYKIDVSPNEMAVVYDNQPQPVKEKNTDELYNYYRTKEFVCNATPLWKLVDVLNAAYSAHIVIGDDRLKNLALTTTFHDESLDDILKVIRETFNIRVEKKGGQIFLQ